MTRAELEHILRAAGAIADAADLIVIGSQAILGSFANAPRELLVSREADVFPRDNPDRADLIDSTIGEGSPFQRAFGYYAHGVGEETAVLPAGWRERLVLITGENTRFIRGWRLEIHDLAISKYVAGREKDLDFTEALIRYEMINPAVLKSRLDSTSLRPDIREIVRQRVERQLAGRC